MNTALVIIGGYALLLLLCWAIIWWAWKKYQKDKLMEIHQHFPHTVHPVQLVTDILSTSDDVIIIDSDDCMIIGFYDHVSEMWIIYNKDRTIPLNFVWMRKPKNFKV